MKKGISIIIPTYNGGRVFSKCLEMIGQQDYEGPIQLIVVDSGSTDGTVALAERAGALIKKIDKSAFHHANTRNEAVLLADYGNIVFTVQDAVPCSTSWLSELERSLYETDVAAVYTDQIPHDDATPYSRFEIESISRARGREQKIQQIESLEAFNEMPYDKAYRAIGLDNVCAIYRRDLLIDIPFPEVDFAEDMAWALKNMLLGHRVMYNPNIRVKHSHNRTPEYGFNRQVVNSYWCARIMKRVKDDLSFVTIKDLMLLTRRFERFCNKLISDGLPGNKMGAEAGKNSIEVIDKILKRHSFKDRITMFVLYNLVRDPKPFCDRLERIAQQTEEGVRHILSLIKANYRLRSKEGLLEVLEQIVANVLGRIYGEVYASRMLAERISPRLEDFIGPYLKGV